MAPDMTNPQQAVAPTQKTSLRRMALARRAMESAADAGHRLREQGLAFVRGIGGRQISGYWPIKNELTPIALMSALHAAGFSIALPVIAARFAPLGFRSWQPGDRLIRAGFGLMEPTPDAVAVLPDVLLVPLAAFDAEGFRIGYGGGYYDRTLELYRAQRAISAIGIAYDCQEVPVFTHEPHDQRLDYLITPSGVRQFGP